MQFIFKDKILSCEYSEKFATGATKEVKKKSSKVQTLYQSFSGSVNCRVEKTNIIIMKIINNTTVT